MFWIVLLIWSMIAFDLKYQGNWSAKNMPLKYLTQTKGNAMVYLITNRYNKTLNIILLDPIYIDEPHARLDLNFSSNIQLDKKQFTMMSNISATGIAINEIQITISFQMQKEKMFVKINLDQKTSIQIQSIIWEQNHQSKLLWLAIYTTFLSLVYFKYFQLFILNNYILHMNGVSLFFYSFQMLYISFYLMRILFFQLMLLQHKNKLLTTFFMMFLLFYCLPLIYPIDHSKYAIVLILPAVHAIFFCVFYFQFHLNPYLMLIQGLFPLPQVIYNYYYNKILFQKKIQTIFLALGSNIMLSVYFLSCPQNINKTKPYYWFPFIVFLLYGLCLYLLRLQRQKGPRFDDYNLILEQECSICLIELDEEEFVVTQCYHIFHITCLKEWKKAKHKTCPVCRQKLE